LRTVREAAPLGARAGETQMKLERIEIGGLALECEVRGTGEPGR
jgi:hypothetical protein